MLMAILFHTTAQDQQHHHDKGVNKIVRRIGSWNFMVKREGKKKVTAAGNKTERGRPAQQGQPLFIMNQF